MIGEERSQAEARLTRRFSGKQSPCEPTDLHCEFICETTKNAHNLMTQVFISYATENKDLMLQIRFSLMRESITIWTNKTDLSEYCQQEVAHAFAHHKRVIELLIEPIDLEQIPPAIRALQFIDLTEHHHPEQYQIGIDKLLNELKQEARYYKQHKILLVKALKWQHQQHNPSILLRGHNLQQAETWLRLAQSQQEHPPLP